MMNEYPKIHSEHLAKADDSYEIRFDNSGHVIHVYIAASAIRPLQGRLLRGVACCY
jgi:hypothetical protein